MNIFWTKCDDCGKDIQIHPTNWQPDGKRRCIPCQYIRYKNKLEQINKEESNEM